MVFNDFHITPSMPQEVAELYGGQKLPCLLFYTQVRAVRAEPGRAGLCCAGLVRSVHMAEQVSGAS